MIEGKMKDKSAGPVAANSPAVRLLCPASLDSRMLIDRPRALGKRAGLDQLGAGWVK